MNVIDVGMHVINALVLDRPCEKVQLTDRSGNTPEINAFVATEGIKHLFAVRLEMRLIRQVHNHVLPRLGNVGHVVLFGIIGNKPVKYTKGYPRLASVQNFA